jgi:hypothetical protein
VHIGAKSSTALSVGPPAGTVANEFTLVVTPLPGSGPVYGGRLITVGGSCVSVLPVPSSPIWIPLPRVSESVAGILGG